VPAKNVADGLIGDFVAEIAQRTSDAIVSPTGVLPSKSTNKIYYLGVDSRSPGIRATLRAIKLLSNELSEPAQNRFRSGDMGNLLKRLSAETFADLRQRGALLVGQPQAIWQMCSEDSVLSSQILDLQQQLLMDQPADVRQNAGPVMNFHPRRIFSDHQSSTAYTYFDHTGKCYLIHDRDPLFTAEFQRILASVGVTAVKLPPQSPNLNAYAERFVRSIKESCLDCLILFGEASLRKAIQQFILHYHFERNHQGLQNRLITPEPEIFQNVGRMSDVTGSVDCSTTTIVLRPKLANRVF
jgi:Integrase core domain